MTSVAACAELRVRALPARSLRLAIESMAILANSDGHLPRLMAVVMMPTPRGLVRIRLSPGMAPEFGKYESDPTMPVTANPYVGSAVDRVPTHHRASRLRHHIEPT